jgi:hypothetical protein
MTLITQLAPRAALATPGEHVQICTYWPFQSNFKMVLDFQTGYRKTYAQAD